MDIDIIINNLKEMLLIRGDNIDEFEEHEKDIDRDEFNNDKNIIQFQSSNTTIIFAMTKKLRKSLIEEIKECGNDATKIIEKYNNKTNIILVFNNDTISAPILQLFNRFDKILQKKNGLMQYFHSKQLMFNPTKHEYVPEHVKLTPEESIEVMEKYLIKSKIQMPFILHTDTIAKWLGLKHGDIVMIKRYNENSGISYYYRVCV